MTSRLVIPALFSVALATELFASDQAEAAKTDPVTSPWDANAWEAGSARVFWRAGIVKAKAPASGKTIPFGSAATPSPAAPLDRVPAKSDLSNRQSEK